MVRLLYVRDAGRTAAPDPGALNAAVETLEIDTVHSAAAGFDRLSAASFDCVLSTYGLPDSDGLAFLRRVRECYAEVPFVLYADDGSEDVASEAITAGVTDYIAAGAGPDRVATHVVDAAEPGVATPDGLIDELSEATEDVLWMVTGDWSEFIYVSSGYAEIWGHPAGELLADPMAFLDAIHPDDRKKAADGMEQLAAGEPTEVELRVNPSEGYQRRVLVRAEPIFGPDSSVARIAGASRDVTEARARQRRLREEKQTVSSIFSAIPDVLYTFDTHGYLLRWNDQLEAETGYSSSEIDEMYVTDFVPDDEVAKITRSFQSITEDRESVTVESAFETKDGDRVPFEFTGGPLESANGELRGVTGVGRNIAERKKRQRRFEAVFNNTYQFTGLMSPDGTLLEANESAMTFAGRDREELVGQKLWNTYWFQANETAKEVARESVETARAGEFFRKRITVQGSDREVVIDFSVRPVTNEDGTVELLIPEGRDITRLSDQSQQLRVTNRFLRHNIRNKLNTIGGYASLVADAENERLQSIGDTIAREAVELSETSELARDIHDLVETDAEPTAVDLRNHLYRAIETVLAGCPDADIEVDAPDAVEVSSLPSLHRAFVELLDVVLGYAETDQPAVSVDVRTADDVIIEVRSEDSTLPPAERDVLTGDIEIKQNRHAQGLGVWYVFWHVRYSGGSVSFTGQNGNAMRIRIPTA